MLVMVLPSHAGDSATGATWSRCGVEVAGDGSAESCWRWCCWGDLGTTRCRCQVTLTTMLPCHAGDGVAKVTWSWRDVDVESCWRQCY
jgi:hypothetical protein